MHLAIFQWLESNHIYHIYFKVHVTSNFYKKITYYKFENTASFRGNILLNFLGCNFRMGPLETIFKIHTCNCNC